MADLSITATSVMPVSGPSPVIGTCGETLANGKAVYLDTADSKWKLADNNSATVAARTATGIVVSGGVLNAPCVIQTGGDITVGATIAAGVAYYLSATAGGICPAADLSAGMQSQVIGMGKTTTIMTLSFFTAGVVI